MQHTRRPLLWILALLVAIVGLAAYRGPALVSATVAAQGSEAPATGCPTRTIAVTGEAEVRVIPDEVVLSVGVETVDTDLTVSRTTNDAIVEALLGLTRAHGIPPRLVQTDYIDIEPRWHDGYSRTEFIGYFVRKSVVVTLRDIDTFEALLSDMLDAGATHVHGVQFRTTRLRAHRDEARALAIAAAREKAEALAGELGQTIGEPVSIREEYSRWWSHYGSWWGYRYSGMSQNVIQQSGGAGYEGDGAVAPGQISVNASVSVTFALEAAQQ